VPAARAWDEPLSFVEEDSDTAATTPVLRSPDTTPETLHHLSGRGLSRCRPRRRLNITGDEFLCDSPEPFDIPSSAIASVLPAVDAKLRVQLFAERSTDESEDGETLLSFSSIDTDQSPSIDQESKAALVVNPTPITTVHVRSALAPPRLARALIALLRAVVESDRSLRAISPHLLAVRRTRRRRHSGRAARRTRPHRRGVAGGIVRGQRRREELMTTDASPAGLRATVRRPSPPWACRGLLWGPSTSPPGLAVNDWHQTTPVSALRCTVARSAFPQLGGECDFEVLASTACMFDR
jgi:hypothetical protein